MWRTFAIISALLIASKCQDLQKLNSIFADDTTNEAESIQKVNCTDIQGDLKDCYDCYLCDSDEIINRPRDEVTPLKMTDNLCESTEVCCIPQSALVARQNDKCGKYYPEGYPRSVRNSFRNVLQGEYPWRAWVFRSDKSKPLCSATYISDDARALMTSASCIKDYIQEKLFVRFSKTGEFSEVQEKIIHENFQAEPRQSDIALISLKSLEFIPKWTGPCCLPSPLEPPKFGAACIAVSDDDNYLNTVIPQQKHCKAQNISASVMCAMAPSNDYTPEPGSALICLEELAKTPKFIVYGIVLYSSGQEITLYTNVTHYISWVDEKLGKIQQQRPRNYY